MSCPAWPRPRLPAGKLDPVTGKLRQPVQPGRDRLLHSPDRYPEPVLLPSWGWRRPNGLRGSQHAKARRLRGRRSSRVLRRRGAGERATVLDAAGVRLLAGARHLLHGPALGTAGVAGHPVRRVAARIARMGSARRECARGPRRLADVPRQLRRDVHGRCRRSQAGARVVATASSRRRLDGAGVRPGAGVRGRKRRHRAGP